jgi:hypothetical protein
MLTLERFIGVITPGTGANGHPITPDQLSDRVHLVDCKLSGLFGGCTSLAPGSVGSFAGAHGLIKEDIILQLSWCTKEGYSDHYHDILVWSSYLARIWHQETVGIINTSFHLHLITEEDYQVDWYNLIVPPADFIDVLDIDDSTRALAYYDNGYTVKSARYEEGTRAPGHKIGNQVPNFYNPILEEGTQ